MMRVAHFVLAISLVAIAAKPSMAQQGSFNRSLTVSGPLDLEVSTGAGRIEIRPGSSGHVEIRGKIYSGSNWWPFGTTSIDDVHDIESNPPIEQTGRIIRIGQNNRHFNNVSISYDITVPADTWIRAHTGSGSHTISGLTRGVEASAGSGSITLTDVKGDVSANAGSGSIRATGLRGNLRMHTGSGSIHAQGEQTGRWELQTGSGSIEIRLPQSAGFDLDAHTGSGGINMARAMAVQGRFGNKHNVTGKVGSGGYTLSARTGSGGIRIE
jgi:hypothetical protein